MTQEHSFDLCAYNKKLSESIAPYTMYIGTYEKCDRYVYDSYNKPFDDDYDDDNRLAFQNIKRPALKCPSRKYNSSCNLQKVLIQNHEI